jgi:hypothetical protein
MISTSESESPTTHINITKRTFNLRWVAAATDGTIDANSILQADTTILAGLLILLTLLSFKKDAVSLPRFRSSENYDELFIGLIVNVLNVTLWFTYQTQYFKGPVT